jgi:membrane-bound lytic murein transglycosylase A
VACALLALASGCAGVDPGGPRSTPSAASGSAKVSVDPPPPEAATIVQPTSRWVPVAWAELPGWNNDRTAQALPALRRQCDARAARTPPTPQAAAMPGNDVATWAAVCADLARLPQPVDDAALRTLLEQRFEPHRVEALDGKREGLATGYFEPLLEASRLPRGAQRHALHRPPAGLVPGQAWYSRKESQTLPAARAALRGREIAYVADPIDVLVMQIQGSGRAVITEPDGRRTLARLAFAAHNERAYQSVGRWLIDQGELKRDGASWPAIRDWTRRNPGRVNEMLWTNPRLVFFHEEPLPDPAVGPRGAQGVPLTAERSIAVDPRSIPYGTPVWLDTTEPSGAQPLRRLVMAQDTGSAIVGAVRADYFWGAGERAEREAGRMKQPLRMWVLVPKAVAVLP